MKKLNSSIFEEAKRNAQPVVENKGRKKRENKLVSGVFEWIQALSIAVVLVILIMTFVCRVVNVDGRSMMNTLIDGDKILVYTLFYQPKSGDVIVASQGEQYDEPIVKRVIAIAGQTVDINYEVNKIVVDGQELLEPYLDYRINGRRMDDDIEFPVEVPDNTVFVLGDNRPESLDSRTSVIGFISCDDIVGKVVAIVMPFDRISLVK